ncbi:hypothetical protein JYU14_04850 [Simkania negevensis]|uniref:ER-bound oxygenase mpaB/mpaB'/Rubber oxygenase catalytic domain-containing protein n=1 Tax=Simkania negevensis TaxID=83561 RepID=A0ABS3ASP7_9BACT|nr:hypothetical protein [Simkania negevensis]
MAIPPSDNQHATPLDWGAPTFAAKWGQYAIGRGHAALREMRFGPNGEHRRVVEVLQGLLSPVIAVTSALAQLATRVAMVVETVLKSIAAVCYTIVRPTKENGLRAKKLLLETLPLQIFNLFFVSLFRDFGIDIQRNMFHYVISSQWKGCSPSSAAYERFGEAALLGMPREKMMGTMRIELMKSCYWVMSEEDKNEADKGMMEVGARESFKHRYNFFAIPNPFALNYRSLSGFAVSVVAMVAKMAFQWMVLNVQNAAQRELKRDIMGWTSAPLVWEENQRIETLLHT